MTKKTTKDVKVIELIERIGELYLCDEPTNEDIANIVSALGDRNYQTELIQQKRKRYLYDEDERVTETFYRLLIYKKVTKEVEE